MVSTLIRGKYVICRITGPNTAEVISDGAVLQTDGEITEVGAYDDLRSRHPSSEVIGSLSHVVMPGLVNDHFHVGLTPCQLGALDNTQEIRALRRMGARRVDPYLDQLYGAIQMIETGTTTVQAIHGGITRSSPSEVPTIADKGIRAYQDSGMRVSYAPTVADQNSLIVGTRGDEREFATLLPGELRERFANFMGRGYAPVEEWMGALEAVFGKYGNGQHERIRITLAPSNVHRCSDLLLTAFKEMAMKYETGIHIHLQESPYQKLYGLKAYGQTPLQHLGNLGFLGPEVVCGHSVWITEEDIDLMVETRTNVCHNASSNLRIHNGIAPVGKLLERGVKVAMGSDEATINDDKDMFQEMRLALRLHYLPGIDNITPTAYQIFQMATEYGAYASWFGDRVGTLEPGKRADIILMNLRNIDYPYIDPEVSIVEAVVYRGRGQDVDMVMIDGDVVLSDGKLTHVDKESLLRELNQSLDRPLEPAEEEARDLIRQIEPHMRRFLAGTFPQDITPHSVYNSQF